MLSFICFVFGIVHCSDIFGGAYLHQDHPNFVVVGVSTFQTNYCGGTVVEADFVITAAHCLFDLTFQDWVRDSSIRVFLSNFKHQRSPSHGRMEVFSEIFEVACNFYNILDNACKIIDALHHECINEVFRKF